MIASAQSCMISFLRVHSKTSEAQQLDLPFVAYRISSPVRSDIPKM